MIAFFEYLIAFPTVIYTVLLGIALFYWVFVVIGFFDLDMFEFDADVDADVDVDVDADIDADVDADVDGAQTSSHSPLGNTIIFLGLSGVPITISYSFVMLWGWLVTYLLAVNVLPMLPAGLISWVAGAAVILVAFVVAVLLTRISIKPLKPIFKSGNERYRNRDIIGESAVVVTGSVTDSFGQAKYCKAGKDLIIEVRCPGENSLVKGSEVVLTAYDRTNSTYRVADFTEHEGIEVS